MLIFFGIKNFGIKNFEPTELGLPQVTSDPYRVEYRQKYFHLYWIPIFGLGKDWFIRKSDDKLYEPLGELKAYLQGIPVKGMGEWHHNVRAFFGLIAIGCLVVFMNLSQAVSPRNSYREVSQQAYKETTLVEENNSLLTQINDLKKDDYLEFRSTSKKPVEIRYAKVTEREGNQLTLAMLKDDLGELTNDQLVNVFFSNPEITSLSVNVSNLKKFTSQHITSKEGYQLTSIIRENKMVSSTYP
jgi:hypothetical protein